MANGEVRCIDSELPFELPKGWEWCRLKGIVSILGDGIHGTPEYNDSGDYFFINGNNLSEGKILIKENTKKVDFKQFAQYRKELNSHTILVSINGTIGNIAFYNNEKIILGKSACYFNLVVEDFKKYLFYLLKTDYFIKYAIENATGSTIKNVSLKAMNDFPIPVAPLAEQCRIVAKLEELLPHIDKYDSAQNQLDTLNDELNGLLKKSILQEAIQGKLVPQCDTDEPATKLLERIKDEKRKLVKAGKLKAKDIVDSVIFKGEDNKYYEQIDGSAVEIAADFDFPSTWEIVRLADVCRLTDGEKKQGRHICLDAKYLRGKSSGDFLDKGKFVTTGDNIILGDGENSGEVFSVPCDGYMGSTFKQLWVSAEMHLPFVLYFIQFYKDRLRNSKKGAAIPHLNKDIFYNLLIGVPPITEQARISSKIDELYSNL